MVKFLLAAFRGDLMCFAHVMLNAVDLRKAGHEVEIMLEGESTKIPKLFADDPKANFYPLWNQIVEGKYITATFGSSFITISNIYPSVGCILFGDRVYRISCIFMYSMISLLFGAYG